MPYTVGFLRDRGLLLAALHQNFEPRVDAASLRRDILYQLNMYESPIYFVCDLRKAKITVDEVIACFHNASQGDNMLLYHPKVAYVFMVTADSENKSDSMQYAGENTRLCKVQTIKKALDLIAVVG